ncbi:outer membrane beta-barrel protein [Hymenobacter negativus]|uniref:Outer membrane protein beta-barrel domain-containing protein n=1 Tax=Hymenobacter negativus TaxID=2795026 RepID=A0ABS0Q2R6_9BACT|nr:outer membrane beta-barrel protein [Hymenobacter negativus]MBH8556940.1 hypothetical protein [Hymenobacter negativus]
MTFRFLSLTTVAALLATAPAARAQTTFSLGLRAGANLANRAGDDPTYLANTGSNSGTATIVVNTQQSYNRQAIIAPQFGAVLDVNFGKLALQPAVLFSQKGVEQTLDATTTTTYSFGSNVFNRSTFTEKLHSTSRANYLEIPVNLVYTTGGDHGFQVFAGPYVAFGLGGRTEIENQGNTTSTNGSGGSSSTNNYYSYGNTFFIYRDTYPGGPVTNSGTGTSGTTNPAPYDANSGAIVARRFDAGLNAGIGYRFRAVQVQLGYGLGLVNQQTGKAPAFSTEPTAYCQRVAQLTATYFFKAGSAL